MFRRVASDSEFQWYGLWVSVGWALVALVIYLSLSFNPPSILEFTFADKLKHMFAYGVLMGWFGQLYSARKSQLIWALAFCLLGVTMEFAQGWGGHRFFDVVDMVANSIGVLLGWWLSNKWLAGSLLRVDHALSLRLR
ncbi:MAG TPA: VanZ family protein [Gammaproteobacteria bacterium]|nr:VanZ family protein [Gammaproteobacteria bacterium]